VCVVWGQVVVAKLSAGVGIGKGSEETGSGEAIIWYTQRKFFSLATHP
jgi:hypothetical protein